jgi:hypothetical protein
MRGLWALVLLLLATPAFAQAPVQHVPTELRASQVCSDSRPAAGSAGSASLTPPAGQFLYINAIEINAAASTGTAGTLGTPASASTTNIPNTATLGVFPIQTQAAGVSIGNFFYALSGNSLKSSAAGTAVTVTTPALTNVAWHISLCGYYAP